MHRGTSNVTQLGLKKDLLKPKVMIVSKITFLNCVPNFRQCALQSG